MHRLRAGAVPAATAFATCLALSGTALAQSAEQFYAGKTIRVICALGTGGSYDANARLFARHIGKHIPGNPNVVVENMPGAGGIIAANHVYKVAAKDGTALGALHQGTTLAQVTKTPNVEYDARKFNWIGRIASGGHDVHYTYAGRGITAYDDMFKREIVVGGGGPTSMSVIIPSAVNKVMGGKLKILGGYKGTAETDLAVERGEVEMALQNWEELRVVRADAIKDKKVHLIIQYSLTRHKELPDLPTIMDKTTTDEQRQIWTLMLMPATIGYTITAGPDVPADRLALLRKAFDGLVKDPGARSDAATAKLEFDPLSGPEVARYVENMFKVDADAMGKAMVILGR